MEGKTFTRSFYLFLILLFPFGFAIAQKAKVTGTVTDDKSQLVSFATVAVEGTTNGTTTDLNGKYELTIDKPGTYTIQVSYVGLTTNKQQVTITGTETATLNFQLKSQALNLDELVVIGYGSQKKSDLTGSITSIDAKDFNTGNVQTPEELIQGKVAGVQITTNGGAPGSGSTIRIRGVGSLNASNDPLFVIDGVPLDNSSIPGSANPLNLINPNDIENMTILKDASATAIYGSRAANGVIIITTKKGAAGKFKLGFSSVNSAAQVGKDVPVLSTEQFTNLVKENGSPTQIALLGSSNTDWQKEIYRVAPTTDDNLSFSGGIKKLPYRLSLGYLNQGGILITDRMQRGSVDLNVSPAFFNNHLKVNISEKASLTDNHFANQGAIGAAVYFDPTQPVLSQSPRYGGYFEYVDKNGNLISGSPLNPIGLINEKDDHSNVYRSISSAQFDYKFPFLPDLHANLNLAYDIAEGKGTVVIPDSAASNYIDPLKKPNHKGSVSNYEQTNRNELGEFYLNYKKEVKGIKSLFDVTAGYTYQDWLINSPNYYTYYGNGDTIPASKAPDPYKTQHTLISFYGRFNYTLNEKYLLTVTLRDDGSSRFAPSDRWGLFPSAALAWRIKEESFLKDSKLFSDLKLRLGYGQTGNQDIGSDYPYFAQYTYSNQTAEYQFGDQFYTTLRPVAYDPNIHWEATTTYNVGLDYGFAKNRINGSIDIYDKKTSDMIAIISIPLGTNFSNQVLTNVGSMENKGAEISINVIPISKKNVSLDLGFNATYNKNKVTKLSKTASDTGIYLVGGISGGVGNTIQIIKSGYPAFSYYVYQQLYDANGKPIEPGEKKSDGTVYKDIDAYKDLNGDGKINNKDFYISKKSQYPKIYLGFTPNFRYKRWTAGAVVRASFGNYLYNNVASQKTTGDVLIRTTYLYNATTDVLNTNFKSDQFFSDYYIQNASFVKIDNINVGYDFGKILHDKVTLKVSIIVQNLYTFTKYTGLDPEISGGIDNTLYPRPRIYSIGLNLQM